MTDPDASDSKVYSAAKIINENYKSDLDFSLQYTRWFLSLLGIWPDVTSNPTKCAKIVSRSIILFPAIMIAAVLVPLTAIPFYSELTATQYILLLSPFSYRVTSICKNIVLILRRDDLKFCIQHMEDDWRCIENSNDRDIMRKNLKPGRNMTIACASCVYSGAFLYNITPYVMPQELNEFNETVRPNNVYGSDMFLDLNIDYIYALIIFLGWGEAFWSPTIIAAICDIAASLVCHTCGQIQIVMSRIENLVGNDESDVDDLIAIKKKIARIIPIHVRVLRFASKIDELLRALFLFEVVSATLLMCLGAYSLVMERKNTGTMALFSYGVLLGSLSFNIFIFCRVGELMKEKFEAVGETAYMTNWYKLPGKTGLAIVMFIRIASYPRKLTAGRIIDLSIMTYGQIMKTSFGYVNMLLTMAQ